MLSNGESSVRRTFEIDNGHNNKVIYQYTMACVMHLNDQGYLGYFS